MPILTIFRPNGEKQRRPVGYGGGLCHKATAPYESRDVPASMSTTPTNEAYMQPAVPETAEEKLSQGN